MLKIWTLWNPNKRRKYLLQNFVCSIYKWFKPFEDQRLQTIQNPNTFSNWAPTVILPHTTNENARWKRQWQRYRVKMRSKPSRTFLRRQIRNSILILRSIFGHSDAVHRSSSKSEKNGMLRHSFDRAVMFFSLQHCIFPALTIRICLHFPNLKLLHACRDSGNNFQIPEIVSALGRFSFNMRFNKDKLDGIIFKWVIKYYLQWGSE